MSLGKDPRDEIKRLHHALREQRLEEEKQFGRKRSKIWDGKPSSKKDRRKEKEKLHKMLNNNNFIEEE